MLRVSDQLRISDVSSIHYTDVHFFNRTLPREALTIGEAFTDNRGDT